MNAHGKHLKNNTRHKPFLWEFYSLKSNEIWSKKVVLKYSNENQKEYYNQSRYNASAALTIAMCSIILENVWCY